MVTASVKLRAIFVVLVVTLMPMAAPAVFAGSLSHDIDSILQSPALAGSITGIEVAEVRSGKVLYARNSDVHLIPASNRKLFTAALAMNTLGPDFRFTTKLVGSKPENGTIRGDVTLVGGGDPLFKSVDAVAMAKSLAATGGCFIDGRVVADASIFTDGPYPNSWGWDTLSDDYSPEVEGLEIDEGVVGVDVAAPGDVTVGGPAGYFILIDKHTTGAPGSPDTVSVTRLLGSRVIEVEGSISTDQKSPDHFTVSVGDVPEYAALIMQKALRDSDVQVNYLSSLPARPDGYEPILHYTPLISEIFGPGNDVLALHTSAPLSDYLPLMLKPSDNLMAECLLRMVGTKASADGKGSFDAAEKLEVPFLASLGIARGDYDFSDGSGVSRQNLVAPRAVVRLLIGVSKKPWFTTYYDALPIAGVDGTLRHRMESGRARGNVHAKTGTVNGDHCLSGYVTTRDGRLLAFSIMNNNYIADVKYVNRVQDEIVERLADEGGK